MRRREFLSAVGAVALPLNAQAQSPTPVVGFLSSLSPSDLGLVVPGFYEGLNGVGLVEGRNIAIEYRWAQGDYRRLPALSADLVNRKVAVLAAIERRPRRAGGEGGDIHNSDRVRDWRRSGRTRAGRQPEVAREATSPA